jgi:prepilin peptidase CpaA
MLSIVWFGFAALAVTAAVVDVTTYRIPNFLVLALIALFFVAALFNIGKVAWLEHFGAALLVMGGGLLLYAFGQMGAGDVKILAALGLWAGIASLPYLLFWVSICGACGMLCIVALRHAVPRLQTEHSDVGPALPRVLRKREGIPYGIGIAPGALIASFGFADWLWRF